MRKVENHCSRPSHLPASFQISWFEISNFKFLSNSWSHFSLLLHACTRLFLLGHQPAPKLWHIDLLLVLNALPSLGTFLVSSFKSVSLYLPIALGLFTFSYFLLVSVSGWLMAASGVTAHSGLGFLYQSLIKKMTYRLAYCPVLSRHFLNWGFLLSGSSNLYLVR